MDIATYRTTAQGFTRACIHCNYILIDVYNLDAELVTVHRTSRSPYCDEEKAFHERAREVFKDIAH